LEAEHAKPAVLLLGSYHMANPNRDAFNIQADDVLTPQRQSEMLACVERLTRFQPTRVALEVSADQADALNNQYQQYLMGAFTLPPDEWYQLGFRVAAALQHERVYPIDWNEGTGDSGPDPIAFAQAHQPELYQQIMAASQRDVDETQARMATASISELLCWQNELDTLQASHRIYLMLSCIGMGKQYVGVEWVKGWYERNLKIFANLTRIVTSPQDRILVIYGAGHIPLLAQFIQDSGLYRQETVERYLR
jgi:hypothetical protein